MKPTIEELLLQIVSIALLITEQGKWHVFVDMQGHVNRVSVRVCDADTDYLAPENYGVDSRAAYWKRLPFEWHPEGKAMQACHDEMAEILAWLQGYLDMPAVPTQEAAA